MADAGITSMGSDVMGALKASDVMGALKGSDSSRALFGERDKAINQLQTDATIMREHGAETRAKLAKSRADMDEATAKTGALTPPTLEPAPQAKPTDIMTQFGSPAMFIAALGSRMTRTPLTSSLNASAAVLDAYKKKDLATAQTQYETWKVNTDNALKLHQFQMDAYKAALAKADKDQAGALAEYQTYAAAFKDDTALMLARIGGIDAAIQHQDAMRRMDIEMRNSIPKLEEQHDRAQALGAVTKAREDLVRAQSLGPEVVAAKTEALQSAIQRMRDVNNTYNPSFAASESRAAANPMGAFVAEWRANHNGEDPPPNELAKFKSQGGGPTLSPDVLRSTAEQYLAGDKSAMQNLGRGAQGTANFVALRGEIARQMAEQNMSGADIATKIAEFEGLKSGERALGTRTANIGMATAEAEKVIPIALEASKAVDRSKYPTLNSLLMAAEKGSGGEAVARFAAANNTLINVYSRAISPGGQPTVSDKEHAREIISTAYSEGQYAAVIDLMKQEIAAARASPTTVREEFRDYNKSGSAGSRSNDTAALPAAARSALKEGVVTTFGNGQKWTLRNGQPEQVK